MKYKVMEGIEQPLSTLVFGASYAAVVGKTEDIRRFEEYLHERD